MANDVTLVDVTLRDGGYVNGHSWQRAEADTIVSGCSAAGIPYSEVGYYRPRRHDKDGIQLPAACCPPDYLCELHERHPQVRLVVMAHARDVELTDYRALRDCGVAMVRLPARIDVFPALPDHVAAIQAAGMQVALNLIRVSELSYQDVTRAARLAGDCGVTAFYLADSNGSLFPDRVTELVRVAADVTAVPLGFHGHDGLSLAFGNSLAAAEAGCRYLDASIGGLGKGGGNLPLELIVGYLRARAKAPLSMAPLVHTASAVLKRWNDSVAARCESIASGLLDLNIDGIAERHAADGTQELVSIVDALPC